jgi:multiple sugar transport system ATP-binding protein
VGGITLERVSKVFPGGVVAVDDVDLEIGDGEFMVLVGPSGCGKSTLLRMIAGLEGVSGGTIRIGDREVTELAPRSRDVAMVFQNYALYPHMRVWDNLAYALRLRHTPKPKMRETVGSVAGVLGLTELVDRKPGALSGGQRQRVAIGRAMVREPQAYLMDEPLSNLDAKLRVGMRAELARLHERLGVTTVYVTHDQVEAMTLGDRVAVLRDGTIQQCDTPERLFDAPANVFVAAFMGSPAMNLVPGAIEDGRLRFAGVDVPADAVPGAAGRRGDVVVGVRPTDLPVCGPDADPGLPRLRAELEVVERLGAESHVIFPVDAPRLSGAAAEAADEATEERDATLLAEDNRARFTARIEGRRRFAGGDTVEFAVQPDMLHLFDPESGRALGYAEPTSGLTASSSSG